MTYTIFTLGCKVNQYESQAMETLLLEKGFAPAEGKGADLVIVNTCAVTGEAGRKSRQAIRRAQKENPNAFFAVCGCFSQISPEEAEALSVDLVSGSADHRGFLAEIFSRMEGASGACRREEALGIVRQKHPAFEELPAGAVEGRTRAMLKIEDGCDNFCSYCIIPYSRGRVRSLGLAAAAESAAALAAEGYRELVITGIEISSYGKDLPGVSLADCIAAISAAAPEVRLHLGSLEPTIVTEDFCRALAQLGNICPHFHLALQSGCDRTLKAMNRKYDTARFFEAASLLRRYFPHCGLTADLITGFPGETEADFSETLAFLQTCAFSAMHIFPYSERPGTRAAAFPESVPKAVREERAKRAQTVADDLEQAYLASCIGKTLSVLFETERSGESTGHSGSYVLVRVSQTGLRGIVRNVKITGISGQILVGDLID